MEMSCPRCGKVLILEINVGGEILDEEPGDVDLDVRDNAGWIMAVCTDCLTNREVLQKTMQSCARVLDTGERSIADMRMVIERIPAIGDDPRTRAELERWEAEVAKARATLEVLTEHEAEFEDD